MSERVSEWVSEYKSILLEEGGGREIGMLMTSYHNVNHAVSEFPSLVVYIHYTRVCKHNNVSVFNISYQCLIYQCLIYQCLIYQCLIYQCWNA